MPTVNWESTITSYGGKMPPLRRKRHDRIAENRSVPLTDNVAIVTGGSKGLGEAMAAGLASAGSDLLLVSQNEDEAKAAASQAVRTHRQRVRGCLRQYGQQLRNRNRSTSQITTNEMMRFAKLLTLFAMSMLACMGCSEEEPSDKVGLVLEVCTFTADFAKTDVAKINPNTTVGEALKDKMSFGYL